MQILFQNFVPSASDPEVDKKDNPLLRDLIVNLIKLAQSKKSAYELGLQPRKFWTGHVLRPSLDANEERDFAQSCPTFFRGPFRRCSAWFIPI